MAARRLLILMLTVLAVSTLAAALVAPPPEPEPTTTTTDDAERAEAKQARTRTGRLIEAELNASSGRLETIRARPGDQLSLIVRSRTGGQVEIPAFGLIEDVGRANPGRFDLLVERTAAFKIQFVGSGRIVGRILVGHPSPSNSNRTRSRR